MGSTEATIKAPENPSILKLAQAIQNADRRTKGSPANLLVPTSLGNVLSRWGYGETTSPSEKVFAAMDIGVPEVSKLAPLLGIFVGAKTPKRLAEALAARERLKGGDNAPDVWRETGWGEHPYSKQMVREIDDSGMKLSAYPDKSGTMQLERIIDHPQLFQDIPRSRLIETGASVYDLGGSWNPGTKELQIGSSMPDSDALDVMVHELDHMAQTHYGLPQGSNPTMFRRSPELRDQTRQALLAAGVEPSKVNMATAYGPEEVDKVIPNATPEQKQILAAALQNWKAADPVTKYMDTAGEAMARLTAKRRTLSAGERSENYPFDPRYFERLTESKIENLHDFPRAHEGGPRKPPKK